RFDLDDLGAVVGEDLRAIGAAKHAREVDHAQSGHRAGSRFSRHGQRDSEVLQECVGFKHSGSRCANARPAIPLACARMTRGPRGCPGGASAQDGQTTFRRTSTLPRVAFEYGQTWWAFATSASASARETPGSETARSISRPKPPSERGPMPTVEVTEASAGTFGPPCEATNFIAPMKQAA